MYSVSFLTTAEALDKLLPPRFELAREPVVTVTASYITDIECWRGADTTRLGSLVQLSFAVNGLILRAIF